MRSAIETVEHIAIIPETLPDALSPLLLLPGEP